MEQHNAKHFALQLGALITLYISLGSLISLLFGVITIALPDPLDGVWVYEGAEGSIRWGIALLVVFFPAFVTLTRIINVDRRTSGRGYLSITKWLIYLSLVVGGMVLLGDIVAIIYNFLNGELTVRFFAKALTVLVVIGTAFTYYLRDAKEYWNTHESQSKLFGAVACALVTIAIIAGYINIKNPTEVRDQRADDSQINDLVTIQSYIQNEYLVSGRLPAELSELSDRYTLPEAPLGRSKYEYQKLNESSFELCATFAHDSLTNQYQTYPMTGMAGVQNPDDWNHKTGRTCFERRVVSVENINSIPFKQ
jgi:hypothetical protein